MTHEHDMESQLQPGEDSELESLYEELHKAEDKYTAAIMALASMAGVIDWLIGSDQVPEAVRQVLTESHHVKAMNRLLKRGAGLSKPLVVDDATPF